MPFWPSSKLNVTVAQTADVTNNSDTNATDITGLSVALPRAGTYQFQIDLPWTAADGTSRTMGLGVTYSGSVTRLASRVFLGTPGGVTNLTAHNTSGTLVTIAAVTATSDRYAITGTIKVSTAGTFKVQFSRSAASITYTGGILTIREG